MDRKLTDFLLAEGIDRVPHTGKSYLAHLIGVYRDMEAAGCSEEICRAGMFHSIYGTQRFQGFKLPIDRRADVRSLIGERAEKLAYLNCAMDRPAFDAALARGDVPFRHVDWMTGATTALTLDELDDLCRIHLYDWLEQVLRSREWNYRRAAYQQMAKRLGPSAIIALESVYAQESNRA